MVAIKSAGAERFLAAPPADIRLFLVHGTDAGRITERARALERMALARGGGEAVIRFGSDEISADPARLADELYSASLFGGEPVVALRILDGRHNVLGSLGAVLDDPPTAAWLVVEAGELKKDSALLKAFEGSAAAAAVQTFGFEGQELVSFISSAATEAGRIVEPAAFDLLAHSLGGDRLSARNELEKLFLYAAEGAPVGIADVEAVVSDIGEVRTDALIDAAMLGDSEALEAGLERLRAEGGSAAGLGAQALRHLLQLSGFRAAMDSGLSASAVLERARPPIFYQRRTAVEAQLKRWSADDLATLRRSLGETVVLTRRQSALESAAISQVLHEIALRSRRLRRGVSA